MIVATMSEASNPIKPKNKGGRPSKYKEEYCQQLIEHMAKGFSFESFAGVVNTTFSTVYEWVNAHPEFSDAKRHAEAKSRIFWEKVGIQGLFMGGKDNPFNNTVWIFNMKNRFGWRDNIDIKQEVTVKEELSKIPNKELVKLAQEFIEAEYTKLTEENKDEET